MRIRDRRVAGRREDQDQERSLSMAMMREEEDRRRMETEREKEKEDKSFGKSFFKVFLPERSMDRLRIPPLFTQFLQNQPIGMVSLKGQSGNTWHADLASDSEGFFFGYGWKKFVTDHSIEYGQFVVFTYDKRSQFSVKIFDTSCIEMMSAQSVQPSKDFVVKKENDEGDMDNVVVTSEKPVTPMNESNRTTGKRTSDIDCLMTNRVVLNRSSDSNVLESAKRKRARASVGTSKALSTSHNSIKDSSNSMSDEDSNKSPKSPRFTYNMSKDVPRRGKSIIKSQRQPTILSQRRPVTEAEKNFALERAKQFKSNKPFALQIMMESYVYVGFFMNIPCDFVRECLPRTNKKLTLWDPQGKDWEVNYVYYSDRSVGSFSGGWGKFAVGNNLEKFDVCVFELVQKDNIKVHIYRVVPEVTPWVIRPRKK